MRSDSYDSGRKNCRRKINFKIFKKVLALFSDARYIKRTAAHKNILRGAVGMDEEEIWVYLNGNNDDED